MKVSAQIDDEFRALRDATELIKALRDLAVVAG